jgi:predicted phosphodiesterase
MQFAFDLISDLHVETWPHKIDFQGQATAPVAVIAGDISSDRDIMFATLENLGKSYQAVFYVDGNDEHSEFLDNLSTGYRTLARQLNKINNVVYLQDNVIVIDGVAILGTNGWWGFDFDLTVDPEQTMAWYQQRRGISEAAAKSIRKMSTQDASYMISSVKRLQTHADIKRIVMVTHTVPDPALIEHDIELEGKYRFNCMGNRYMMQALAADTEKKIHTWCFGHYHGSVDQVRSGVRFVNNCRGRGDNSWGHWVYHPRRIVIDV